MSSVTDISARYQDRSAEQARAAIAHAEEVFIASLLVSAGFADQILSFLPNDALQSEDAKTVYALMRNLRARNEPLDLITIAGDSPDRIQLARYLAGCLKHIER